MKIECAQHRPSEQEEASSKWIRNRTPPPIIRRGRSVSQIICSFLAVRSILSTIFNSRLDMALRLKPSSSPISTCGTASKRYSSAMRVSSIPRAASWIAASHSERVRPVSLMHARTLAFPIFLSSGLGPPDPCHRSALPGYG